MAEDKNSEDEENKNIPDSENDDNKDQENQDNQEVSNDPEEDGSDVNGIKKVDENIISLDGLYENWFLDYASYVILERAVPGLNDGLKPVQRRILHSMKELEDGRYNKVANLIGNTMKYHPHGDASIGDAMVQMGQKELLIDMQGNWGNTLTGDGAAAPRYIEARLSKFALHVAFNAKTTEWLTSYDGRNKEPEDLPMKFPLLLAQGAEGIAVGLACKILPHNFIELIDNSINHLRGKKVEIFPDFLTGGMADFTNYNDGLRGGKVRVRAKINKIDNKTLSITEIPFGTNTSSLIDSILRANDKGKIKIKKIDDNTAAEAEILIHLASNVSPDKLIDALYAFTDCEVSISPNSTVIDKETPRFLGMSEILKHNTDNTVRLLKRELEIRKEELEEQWHFSSLEKIFIENKVYSLIEEEETWEGVISAIDTGLKPFTKHLKREVTRDDIIRLTEIKIKRISKFDKFKADEIIQKIEDELAQVISNIENIIEFSIDYFKDLKKRFGEGKERKTEIRVFDNINASKVIIANEKLYVDFKEGFIGYKLRKADYIQDCSEIDDIIVFFDTGKMMITKVADKKFVGKGILHAAVWKRGDKRTVYHVIYKDGKSGNSYMKRFLVNSITRDKEYDLTTGKKGSKLHYFSAHPNGEREVVTIHLKARTHLKKLKLDVDLGEQLIKSRSAKGNIISKEPISKVTQKEVGGSTLAARKIWYDDIVGRLNDDQRGKFLGQFRGDDKILTLYKNGEYRLSSFDLTIHFGDDMIHIEKWKPEHAISAVYYDPEKEIHYAKRFVCEVTTDRRVPFIPETEGTELNAVSTAYEPEVRIVYNKLLKATKHLPDRLVRIDEFIDVKGMKSIGNQLEKLKVKEIELTHPIEGKTPWPDEEEEATEVAEEENEEETDDENQDNSKAAHDKEGSDDDSNDDSDKDDDDSSDDGDDGDDDGDDDQPKGGSPKPEAIKEKPTVEKKKPVKKVKSKSVQEVQPEKTDKQEDSSNKKAATNSESLKKETQAVVSIEDILPPIEEKPKPAPRRRSLSRRPIKDKPAQQVTWDLFSSTDEKDKDDKDKN
ncbi:DNA gyrase/topoisomerase IV subunit A [Brumimicrobium oceani]|uniref:DNA gyrase/topoisomerase IV subunit A n=1 Tax=Brumimicrobium oceani TaxID=2100725 RepID=A0A2U2XH41_9FLAO|nr:DNA gyrase/topoisomerase IV subunit A [Brumimicrobium oceani]PWH87118.1 DNA gyrase/topoisomerase IV subunit A [Brumimicrobium oceani]